MPLWAAFVWWQADFSRGPEQGRRICLCRCGLHSCGGRQISVVEDWRAVASSHGLGLLCVVPLWAPFGSGDVMGV